jgi:hypothetical protein
MAQALMNKYYPSFFQINKINTQVFEVFLCKPIMPSGVSHIFAELSPEVVTIFLPSGENTALLTLPAGWFGILHPKNFPIVLIQGKPLLYAGDHSQHSGIHGSLFYPGVIPKKMR